MDIINYFTRIRCPKIVRPKKFEYYQTNNQVWWSNQFKELEAGIKVPPYRRLSELKKVFSDEELRNLTLAGLEYENDVIDMKKRLKKGPYFKIKRKTFRSCVLASQRTHFAQKKKIATNFFSYVPTPRCNFVVKKHLFADELIDFFQKPPCEADCWSPRPRRFTISLIPYPCINKARNIEEMLAENFEEFFNKAKSLLPLKVDVATVFIHKAKRIEKILAENFEDYFNKFQTITPLQIDKDTILDIFEITNTLPITKAFFIDLQLLFTVPDQVAIYLGDARMGTSCALQREINRDLIDQFSRPISHAFGSMLPENLRRFKSTSNHAIKWLKHEIKHENLRTFAAVFEGILDLETSKQFVLWLQNHREIKPPEYLLGTCIKMRKSKKFFLFRKACNTPNLSRCDACTINSEDSNLDNQIMV